MGTKELLVSLPFSFMGVGITAVIFKDRNILDFKT